MTTTDALFELVHEQLAVGERARVIQDGHARVVVIGDPADLYVCSDAADLGRVSVNEIAAILRRVRDDMLAEIRVQGFFYLGEKMYTPIPWDINNGYCEQFGERVLALLPPEANASCEWVDSLLDVDWADPDMPSHYVICIGGRYYDAECLDGVEKVLDLPIFARRSRDDMLERLHG